MKYAVSSTCICSQLQKLFCVEVLLEFIFLHFLKEAQVLQFSSIQSVLGVFKETKGEMEDFGKTQDNQKDGDKVTTYLTSPILI